MAIENEDAPVDEEITVVEEDISLRGEYEKHYLMSDGSYQAVVYGSPVHELVDGVWVEIESTNQNARGSVTTDNAKQNIIDNYVLQGAGVQDKSKDRLYIGNRSAGLTRAYIRFATMPTIPSGAIFISATMTLHLTSGTSTAANASAYMVTGGSWESGEIQWSTMPAANTLLQSNISHNDRTGYTFSCLTAVQHWYDGDTTGQNENYGIMLRYYDETVEDYNAVYSADHTDASLRPSLTITYQPPSSSVRILEGGTHSLSIQNVSGDITWVSDDTSVATVDSSGRATGIKAGKTAITASVDGIVQKRFTVYVTIADGVYYIKNGTTLCLGTYGRIADGTDTWLFAKATSGRTQLNQLWKITYLDYGYYSIRPMYKLDMGLCSANAAPGIVEITTLGASNTFSDISRSYRWTINYDSNGYMIRCAGASYLSMQGSMPYPEASVVTKEYTPSESGFIWQLEKVTETPNQVLLLDVKTGATIEDVIHYIEVADTLSLADLGITTSFVCPYSIDQSISWSSNNPSVVSVDSSTGAITGLSSGGTATIIATHIHNGIAYNKYYTVHVICPNPLDPSKIEYMAQTRITGRNWTGEETDHSITLIKSKCSSDPFFTATDNINGQVSRSYVIDDELKNQLDSLEDDYQDGYNILPLFDKSTADEKTAHAAKGETDQLVEAGHFSSSSDMYYGVWAYNYISLRNLGDMWGSILDTTTKAYNVYLAISAFYYSWQASVNAQSVYISSSQYDDVAAFLDDIDDAANGFTFSSKTTLSAEERNAALSQQGYTTPLPYQPNTPVIEGKVSMCSSNTYVRVYTNGVTSRAGRWFMKYSDIQGLTATEIQAKYALPYTPTHYSIVTVPEGVTVYIGAVNNSTTGAIQFEFLEYANEAWFGQGTPLA